MNQFMNQYRQQVELLVKLLALVDTESCFALKGGTAINLFVQNLPRLSVDIDLVYLPNENRTEALEKIKQALDRLAAMINQQFMNVRVVKTYLDKEDALRLVVTVNGVLVKIELSPVLRGTVFAPERRRVVSEVEDQFGFAEINVVSLPDLYAGKFCAALDRQHPRDLFDVKLYLDNFEIDDQLRKAFIVYLISHSRPISELLKPNLKSLSTIYKSEFKGMTFVDVSLEDLESSRLKLIKLINNRLTDDEKQFLISFQKSQVDWSLLGLDKVNELSAVRWKQLNIDKMNANKLKLEVTTLKRILNL